MKKSIKLLMLLLTVALIVGSIAVVASAATDTREDDSVELTADGVTTKTTLIEAFNAVSTSGTIKLLGNQTVAAGVQIANSAQQLVLDLNGYTIDSSANSKELFVKSGGNFYIVGEGEIKHSGPMFVLNNASNLYVEGEGAGIKFSSTSIDARKFLAATKDNNVVMKNVTVDYTATIPSLAKGLGYFVDTKNMETEGGNFFLFENCSVNLNYSTTVNKVDASKYFLFKATGNSCFVLNNSEFRTTCSGIEVTKDSVGANYDVDGKGNTSSDKYSLVMLGSSITCRAAESTEEYCAAQSTYKPLLCYAVSYKSAESTSDIYVGSGSSLAASGFIANGFVDATANTSSIIVSDSYIELINDNVDTGSDGMFSGPAYVNVKFGGGIITNGLPIAVAGTSIEGNAQGMLNAEGVTTKYSVDLALGAKLDVNVALDTATFDFEAGGKMIEIAAEPRCRFAYATDAIAELLKYGPVKVNWYCGAGDYAADKANVKSTVIYLGQTPVAPANEFDVVVGNVTYEFVGWSNVYYPISRYATPEAYMAATKGAIVQITPISAEQIISSGSTLAYFPVYKVKSVEVTYTWYNIDGTVANTVTVTDGSVPTFDGIAKELTTDYIKVSFAGKWNPVNGVGTVDYYPEYKTALIEKPAAKISVSILEGFKLNLTISSNVYSMISSADQARFTGNNTGTEYTCTESFDINEFFTTADFSFTVVDGGYKAELAYEATVYDYLEALLEDTEAEQKDRKIAYYALAYAEAAYGYFEYLDNYNSDFSVLTDYANVAAAEDFTIPENTNDYSALTGKFFVALDLTSRHQTIIGVTDANYAGKVKINGAEMELTDGKLVMDAAMYNLIGTMTLELDADGDGTYEAQGTYSILDYEAGLAQTDAAAVIDALVDFAYYCAAYNA